jgi:hypothetical protein
MKLIALVVGVIVGATLFFWYLGRSIENKTTSETFLFIPLVNLYEPTFMDYLIAAIIALVSLFLVFWIINRLSGRLFDHKPHPAQ